MTILNSSGKQIFEDDSFTEDTFIQDAKFTATNELIITGGHYTNIPSRLFIKGYDQNYQTKWIKNYAQDNLYRYGEKNLETKNKRISIISATNMDKFESDNLLPKKFWHFNLYSNGSYAW